MLVPCLSFVRIALARRSAAAAERRRHAHRVLERLGDAGERAERRLGARVGQRRLRAGLGELGLEPADADTGVLNRRRSLQLTLTVEARLRRDRRDRSAATGSTEIGSSTSGKEGCACCLARLRIATRRHRQAWASAAEASDVDFGAPTPVVQQITVGELEGRLLPAVGEAAHRVDGVRVAYDEVSGTLIRPEGLAPRRRLHGHVGQPAGGREPVAGLGRAVRPGGGALPDRGGDGAPDLAKLARRSPPARGRPICGRWRWSRSSPSAARYVGNAPSGR